MNNQRTTTTLYLDGLTCTSCETRIEHALTKLDGVWKVKVSYVTSTLTITYNQNKTSLETIIKTIENLDYVVKKSKIESTGKVQNNSYTQFIVIGILVLGMYLIIKNTVGFNYIPAINDKMGYAVLFVVGLLSSLHCVAMCGGINLSLCVSYQVDKKDSNKFAKLIPSLMYNAGRVVSYTIIGGIVGALGSVFRISNTGGALISILAGVFMIIMGANMLNLFPWLRKLNPHMPKIFAKKIQSQKKGKGPFIVGLLNGLMPCGPLQAMQLYALGTGSFITGALSMFLFSLGTVPLLFVFGAIGSLLKSSAARNMIKVSAAIVIALGLVMVNRGFAITGITFPSYTADSNGDTANSSTINGDVQEITTTLESGTYPAITVQAGIPVKWTIIVDANNLNGCNNEIIIPNYNVKKSLQVGENVISFTPTKTGKFGYSCWMGMIRSNITVVSDKSSANTKATQSQEEVDNSGLPAGCCGL